MTKIYVASSWRNERQPAVVRVLRAVGHEVYDFRNPPAGSGFGWEQLDGGWESWTPTEYRAMLSHPVAEAGFASDNMAALHWADVVLLVMPCGRSSHLELGWAAGAGKRTVVLWEEASEPELMVKMADDLCLDLDEVLDLLPGELG